MKSMTGFGSSENNNFKVQIRALNNRFCEVIVKMPVNLFSLEESIRKIIQDKLKRGRIEVSITQSSYNNINNDIFKINNKLAQSYVSVLKKISAELDIPFKVGIEFIAKIPGIVQQEESIDLTRVMPVLKTLVIKAVDDLNYIREKEGKVIEKDFAKRLKKIEIILQEVIKKTPLVVSIYKKNLEKRLKKILENNTNLDKKQVLNEVAIFAERSDITEEVIRLGSHLKQFNHNLSKDMPVGRTLDFILQETNREINTIGSKANDAQISQKVILIKAELEKLREQVQNVL